MADKLPQSVEELLAAHKAVVDAMSPKQRTAYYAQITADQIEYARDNPYNGGERQAQAMMPKGFAVVADTDPITAEFARAAIAAAARLTAENAVLLAERDQWRGTAMNKLEMVNSTALREKDATINSLTARGAVKPLEWESIKTAPRNGEWFFAKTARGTIRFVHFGDIYDRFPISHDHTEIWETEPVEWISTSRVLSALSIHTDAMAALEAVRAQADHAGYDRCKERAAQLIEALFIGGGVAKIAAQIRALEGSQLCE